MFVTTTENNNFFPFVYFPFVYFIEDIWENNPTKF